MTYHLVTLGFTPRLRALVEGLEATHVAIDMTASTTPDEYLLAVVDVADAQERVLVAVGPLAFGFVCAGQMRPLRDWAALWPDRVLLVVTPDDQEPESYPLAAEVYTRLDAAAGLGLWVESGLRWVTRRTRPGVTS